MNEGGTRGTVGGMWAWPFTLTAESASWRRGSPTRQCPRCRSPRPASRDGPEAKKKNAIRLRKRTNAMSNYHESSQVGSLGGILLEAPVNEVSHIRREIWYVGQPWRRLVHDVLEKLEDSHWLH
jgi:hypothetical protein